MAQLLPIFRILPALLFIAGILITAVNIWELNATQVGSPLGSTYYPAERVSHIAALVRSFYDLVFLWGMAALVAAANKYLEAEGDAP